MDARLDSGTVDGQATGAAIDAGQYDPEGHTTGNDALTGQYVPAWERKKHTIVWKATPFK